MSHIIWVKHTYTRKQKFKPSSPTFTLDNIRYWLRFCHFKLKYPNNNLILTLLWRQYDVTMTSLWSHYQIELRICLPNAWAFFKCFEKYFSFFKNGILGETYSTLKKIKSFDQSTYQLIRLISLVNSTGGYDKLPLNHFERYFVVFRGSSWFS